MPDKPVIAVSSEPALAVTAEPSVGLTVGVTGPSSSLDRTAANSAGVMTMGTAGAGPSCVSPSPKSNLSYCSGSSPKFSLRV
eukprot:11267305-Alexandrium_andersonii.AAC.1